MKQTTRTSARFLSALTLSAITVSALAPSSIYAMGYSFSDQQQTPNTDEQPFEQDEPVAISEDGTVVDEGDGYRFEFNTSEGYDDGEVPDNENVYSAGESIISRDKDEEYEYTVDVDPRSAVTDTTQNPYSAICKLTMTFEDANGDTYQFVGSGYVINANTILTCGHCVYDHENSLGWVKSIWIEPGRNGSSRPFSTYATRDISYIEVDEKWIERAPEDNDNALIVLNKNIGAETGILPLSTDGVQASELHLSGYPAKFQKAYNAGTQVHAFGQVLSLKSRCLESDVYGSGGQSGSPILNEKGEVVATYAYSYVFKNRTGGPIIDQERLEWINTYAGKPVNNTPEPQEDKPTAPEADNGGNREGSGTSNPVNTTNKPSANTPGASSSTPSGSNGNSDQSSQPSKPSKPADNTPSNTGSKAETASPVYRLYNPNSGEHFYTMNASEKDALAKIGWKYEGVAWNSSSAKDALPVYRVYNPNSGDHHYTTDQKEYEALGKLGWKKEGTSWMAVSSKTSGALPVYRIYNPNAKVGQHHFTQSEQEAKTLIQAGWKNENIGFYTAK